MVCWHGSNGVTTMALKTRNFETTTHLFSRRAASRGTGGAASRGTVGAASRGTGGAASRGTVGAASRGTGVVASRGTEKKQF